MSIVLAQTTGRTPDGHLAILRMLSGNNTSLFGQTLINLVMSSYADKDVEPLIEPMRVILKKGRYKDYFFRLTDKEWYRSCTVEDLDKAIKEFCKDVCLMN